MPQYEYKVAYMDFRGRISIEGEELFIEKEERRSTFARRVLDQLGAEGWDLVGIQQLWPAETSYFIFKREKTAGSSNTTSTFSSDHTQHLPNADLEDIEPRGPIEEV